ncbi:hypothetical protein [Telmatospirillum sp.]|uniref:hypothetical protein n=1 Tax=Telmatospirillum sp. TaxID=2079197 RepID=UPI00284C1D17|nr:hypothetical protein [Telmatospirillum sp.]MDR3438017.1 hypothetical protein [Telmatospirillum sp.]
MVPYGRRNIHFRQVFVGLVSLLAAGSCPAARAADTMDLLFSTPQAQVIVRTLHARDDDPGIKVVELNENGRTIWGSRNAYLPGTVQVLWRQQKPETGPDLIIGGYTGGSHCSYDVMAIDLENDQPVQTISMCNHDLPAVTSDEAGRPRFSVFFDIEGFNAASAMVAGVEIPMLWDGEQFVVDGARLLAPQFDRGGQEKIEQTIRQELGAWTIDAYRPGTSYDASAPETNQALLDLILHGHAVEARNLLNRAWPQQIGGRDQYWDEFTGAIVKHHLWKQLGLAALVPLDAIPGTARHF